MPADAQIMERPGAPRPLGCDPKTEKCRIHKGTDIAWTAEKMVNTLWTLPSGWSGTIKKINRAEKKGESNQRYITIELDPTNTLFNLCGVKISLYHVDIPPSLQKDQKVNSSTILGTTSWKIDPGSKGVHLHLEIEIPGMKRLGQLSDAP